MGAAPHTAARTPLQALSALETFRSAIGALASRALPFVVSLLTTVVPAAAMAVLGPAGAASALHTVTHADPLTALESNR